MLQEIIRNFIKKHRKMNMNQQLGNIRKTLSKTIEPDDEHLVRITDATFLD